MISDTSKFPVELLSFFVETKLKMYFNGREVNYASAKYNGFDRIIIITPQTINSILGHK